MLRPRTPAALALLALPVLACAREETSAAAPAGTPAAAPAGTPAAAPQPARSPAAAGELLLTAQPGWIVETPTSAMRKAQYRLPRTAGDDQDASLVVYHFGPGGGGSREANLARWAAQFEQPDGSEPRAALRSSTRTVAGLEVTDVESAGTYVAETSPGSGERHHAEGWRLLASIIETPAGPYYAKLVGPAATVARWEASYRSFVDAVELAP